MTASDDELHLSLESMNITRELMDIITDEPCADVLDNIAEAIRNNYQRLAEMGVGFDDSFASLNATLVATFVHYLHNSLHIQASLNAITLNKPAPETLDDSRDRLFKTSNTLIDLGFHRSPSDSDIRRAKH